MPLYEYYCRPCKTKFELMRPMSRSSEPATCPSGHAKAGRTVSVFAARTTEGDGASTSMAAGGCGGCAGGACAACAAG